MKPKKGDKIHSPFDGLSWYVDHSQMQTLAPSFSGEGQEWIAYVIVNDSGLYNVIGYGVGPNMEVFRSVTATMEEGKEVVHTAIRLGLIPLRRNYDEHGT